MKGSVIFSKAEQPVKTPSPMLVTLAGMLISERDEQLRNA